ncbi:MAG TPA: neutral zinc metallopeptidase [Micromonosporaceae bacterium]
MELNRDADVDTSQVEDVRGAGGGGGFGGLPIPLGGGRGGIIGTIIGLVILLAGGGWGASQMLGGSGGGQQADNGKLAQECSTANPNRTQELDCRNTLYVNSIQNFWQHELPQVFGKSYQQAKTVFFSQQVTTGCGAADSGVGPFYCPADNHVYIDLTFYNELANRFGAKGEFAQPYVLAHEYGHHVQDLLGTEAQVDRQRQRDPGAANQLSVMLELQADCYAGVWAKHATQTTDASGKPIFTNITQQDIQQALDAAAAVGDDAIQKKVSGRVDESKFTHGSSAQRDHWFSQGYTTGDPKSCDTFGSGG